jgi:glycosyltransferase involved in cell wall biosynthesis
MMKILYVTARWNPEDPDSGAGFDYLAYSSLQAWAQDLTHCGPFDIPPTRLERGITRAARLFSEKRLVKFYPSYIRFSNQAVEKMLAEYQPDVIVSKASIPLVNVKLTAPLVYMCDSTVNWVKREWPHFSKFGFWLMERWERKVINKARHIITFSEANASVLKSYYQKPAQQISVHPIPSAIPHKYSSYDEKRIHPDQPVNLVLVGKTFTGKGVDIAIEVTRLCNQSGITAQLRIVGQEGVDAENIRFMGYFHKKDPHQLQQYVDNYRWAHFLIFPSRFDAAGIVPSEAAAFGVPTITNAAGGIPTTVAHEQSGIVLGKHSPPEAYFEVIQHYWENPADYQALRQSTYQRYQSTLNWEIFGAFLSDTIQRVVPGKA